MNLLLLSGNSPRNKAWIDVVDSNLSELFTQTLVHQYAHWETGADFIDFDLELSRLTDAVTMHQPYAIFAKSVGSILTLQGLAAGKLLPRAILIAGLPLKLISELTLPVTDWLRQSVIPILIVQNENDPVGSYNEVAALISTLDNDAISTMSLPGKTHEYEDFSKLKQLAAALLT